jgi:nitrous oxidase accessory protein
MSSVASAATVHEVPSGGSIAAVLKQAEPGDTVYLAGGIYHENIVVNVPVVLTGAPGAVIRGGYEGNVVHITAPGTVLEELHVAEAGPRLTKDMACVLVEAEDVTIRNCAITESLHGIYVKAGNGTKIIGNRIEGRLDLIEADRGNGIHLWNSSRNHIIGNEIINARDGIYFSFANSTEVERNHIHHVRYGLHYMYSNDNSFYENLFENNVAGAALMYSEDIVFARNTFARCRGFRAYGILLQSMSRVTATSNLIIDNSRGIFMNNADTNVIEHNATAISSSATISSTISASCSSMSVMPKHAGRTVPVATTGAATAATTSTATVRETSRFQSKTYFRYWRQRFRR